MQQILAGLRISLRCDVRHRPFTHQSPTALACTWSDVDDVIRSTDGVFIVFHHHQRVAFVAEQVQRIQQNLVVARMQANGGLVQHIAHALQIAAQLRGQSNALRFATAEGGRTTV